MDGISSAALVHSRLPFKYQRQDIETQVLNELRHRVKLYLAVRAPRHDHTVAALSYRGWLIDKAIKIVLPKF